MRISNNSNIDPWLDRVRRMADYHSEAADFLNRAGSILPVVDTDVELVCWLWTIADELDMEICEALQRFDDTLFEAPGEIDITRGAEPVTSPDGNDTLAYLCTWTLARPESQSAGVVLMADQVSGRLELEVRQSTGVRRAIRFPMETNEELYEGLTSAFFALHVQSTQP